MNVDRVAYEAALSRLPDAHALALRLVAAGATKDEMCGRLGIEPESLEPLVDLARRKLSTELAVHLRTSLRAAGQNVGEHGGLAGARILGGGQQGQGLGSGELA